MMTVRSAISTTSTRPDAIVIASYSNSKVSNQELESESLKSIMYRVIVLSIGRDSDFIGRKCNDKVRTKAWELPRK